MSALDFFLVQLGQPDHERAYSRADVDAAIAELAALRERAESAEKWTCVRCNTKHDAATDEMGPPYVYCHGCERERAERRGAWPELVREYLDARDALQATGAGAEEDQEPQEWINASTRLVHADEVLRTALRRVAGEEQAGGDASTREGEVGEASHLSNVSPALSRFVEAAKALRESFDRVWRDYAAGPNDDIIAFDAALAEIGKAAP